MNILQKCLLLLLLGSLLACSNKKKPTKIIYKDRLTVPVLKVLDEFQSILDTSNLDGIILVYSIEKNTEYSNNFELTKKQHLPASTYKFPHSIIALETGVIESDSTMFYWDGQARRLKIWEQDLNFREAFRFSCVPCYQQIASKIGAVQMNLWLDSLDYGNTVVNDTNIDLFWLEGEDWISPEQQMDFLKRYFHRKLPIQERTYSLTDSLLFIEEDENGKWFGKTGWAIRGDNNTGWFIGYLTNPADTIFVVSCVEPKEKFPIERFGSVRMKISKKAIQCLISDND